MRKKVTTRPRIVQALLSAGVSCKQIPNVFDPSRRAWEYPDTPEARQIVAAAIADIEAEKARAGE